MKSKFIRIKQLPHMLTCGEVLRLTLQPCHLKRLAAQLRAAVI
jgi:hypothetical protein